MERVAPGTSQTQAIVVIRQDSQATICVHFFGKCLNEAGAHGRQIGDRQAQTPRHDLRRIASRGQMKLLPKLT
jgi:hypothetical protein